MLCLLTRRELAPQVEVNGEPVVSFDRVVFRMFPDLGINSFLLQMAYWEDMPSIRDPWSMMVRQVNVRALTPPVVWELCNHHSHPPLHSCAYLVNHRPACINPVSPHTYVLKARIWDAHSTEASESRFWLMRYALLCQHMLT